ncbi:MAG TPA: lipid II flippase MurJ [Ferruginibacter sp.]|nr:lipid II flippase MurJ [Ferruginibacter sp.]
MGFLGLIRSESYKKGTVLSVFFNAFSKGILFLLTVVIARYFGSDIKTDIYFFVFGAMLLFSGFINTIDTAVLIPESMRIREREGKDKSVAFLNYFLWIYVVIGILFTGLMYFFGSTVFGLISKFSEQDILTYHSYFRSGSLFFIFHLLTNYVNTILTSLKFFSIPMIISSIKSCIAIACIFLLKSDYDVLSVFLGGLLAYAVNLIFLIVILKKIAGWKFTIQPVEIKKKIWGNIFYAELGQVATLASSLFPLYLLSGFGSGVLSVMNYGKNIADIPNTLVTTQFANVSGIKLNEEVARHDHAAMNSTFVKTSKLLLFILVPMSFYLFVFATPVVQLFYQSKNFTTDAAAESAFFLQLLSVIIFSIGINAMVTRIFIAVQAIRQAFLYQVALNLLLILAIWIFTRQYGAYGYPYGLILMNMVNYIGMYFICKKLVKEVDYAAIIKYTVLVIMINAVIATALYFLLRSLNMGILPELVIGFLLYLMILLVLNDKMNLNKELGKAIKNVKQRFY